MLLDAGIPSRRDVLRCSRAPCPAPARCRENPVSCRPTIGPGRNGAARSGGLRADEGRDREHAAHPGEDEPAPHAGHFTLCFLPPSSLVKCCRLRSPSRQLYSRICCSAGTRLSVNRISIGFTNTVGSVTVASYRIVSAIEQPEPLEDVFVLVDEIPRHVQPGPPVEIADVDDQRVAFPASARVSVPGPVVLRVRAVVRRDDADVVHGFVKQRHVLFVLDDLHGVETGGLIEGARNAGQVTPRLGILISALQAVQPVRLRPPACIRNAERGGRRRRPGLPRPSPRPPPARRSLSRRASR